MAGATGQHMARPRDGGHCVHEWLEVLATLGCSMQFSGGDPIGQTRVQQAVRLCIEDQPGFVFFVRAWMGFGIFGGGMDLNREVALCIKKLHQQWEAAVWTSGQVAHQRPEHVGPLRLGSSDRREDRLE